jgi:putative membrane protein
MNDSTLRDNLALERTRLANERTFLAYVRTALSLMAGSAVLFQFFSDLPPYLFAAWALVVGGGLTLVVGLVRFLRVARQLKATPAVE